MTALAVLIVCYLLVIIIGKNIKTNYLGYIFVGVITMLQVAFMLFYMFTMDVPTP